MMGMPNMDPNMMRNQARNMPTGGMPNIPNGGMPSNTAPLPNLNQSQTSTQSTSKYRFSQFLIRKSIRKNPEIEA